MTEKIAIISDLHCHPSALRPQDSFLFSDMLALPSVKNPVTSVCKLIEEKDLKADTLFVLGDITNKINQAGLVSGWSNAKEIARKLGANLVIATVGNHDVDSRKSHGSNPFEIAKRLDVDYPFPIKYGHDTFWADGFQIIELENMIICVINSITEHLNEVEAKRGAVTELLLEKLEQKLKPITQKKIRIALAHHHPIPHEDLGLGSDDLMVLGTNLIECLNKHGFNFFMHGHKHMPRIKYASGKTDPFVVFAAGSFSAFGQLLSNTRNLFHMVDFDYDDPSSIIMKGGKILSWEFQLNMGWKPASVASASFPHVCGFGYRTDFPRLAEKVFEFLSSLPNKLVKDWNIILDKFPEASYLTPADSIIFCEHLKSHGVTVEPNLPEKPNIIGILR